MTSDDSIKRAVLKLLKRGQVTQSEAAHLAGRSRQIVRHWAKDLPDARQGYLAKLWAKAIGRKR